MAKLPVYHFYAFKSVTCSCISQPIHDELKQNEVSFHVQFLVNRV